jgi:hypothetical protein
VFSAHLYARVRQLRNFWHMRPRVQRAPGIPCALYSERAEEFQKLGQSVPRGSEAMSDIVSRALRSMERQRNDALQTRDP